MPLKFVTNIGSNQFECEGDFVFDDGFAATFRLWLNGQQIEAPGKIADMTTRLRAANDAVEQAVVENTPS